MTDNILIEQEKKKLGLLHYEIKTFEYAFEELNKKISNEILECFLTHSRNLIDFFCGTAPNELHKKYCDDIIISDFRDGDGNDLTVNNATNEIATIKREINYRLSHLSSKRLRAEIKPWNDDIKKIREFIKPIYKNFIGNINNDYFPAINKRGEEISKKEFEKFINENKENFVDYKNENQSHGATDTQQPCAQQSKTLDTRI